MLRFGICTEQQYLRAGPRRRDLGAQVAYSLLDLGNDPTEERVAMFEDLSFRLRTSNGTFRTSFSQRFPDLDTAASRWMAELFTPVSPIQIQDRAASHCLTSHDWAQRIFAVHSHAEFEASDLILCLYELSLTSGETYIVEPGGEPLQYIRPPFVLSVRHREPRRYPLNLWLGARARRRFARLGLPEGWQNSETGRGYRVRRLSCVHPRAASLSSPRLAVPSKDPLGIRGHAAGVRRAANNEHSQPGIFFRRQTHVGGECRIRQRSTGRSVDRGTNVGGGFQQSRNLLPTSRK